MRSMASDILQIRRTRGQFFCAGCAAAEKPSPLCADSPRDSGDGSRRGLSPGEDRYTSWQLDADSPRYRPASRYRPSTAPNGPRPSSEWGQILPAHAAHEPPKSDPSDSGSAPCGRMNDDKNFPDNSRNANFCVKLKGKRMQSWRILGERR